MSLTLRGIKGSALTHGELDNNFIWLSGRDIVAAVIDSNSNLILTKEDSSYYSVPLSGVNTYISGLTFSGNVLTITQSDGASVSVNISSVDIRVTDLVYSADTLILYQSDGSSETVLIPQFSGGTINGPTNFTNGLSANTFNTTSLTLNGVTITGFTSYDYTFTGGTVTGPTNFTNGLSANTVNTESLILNGVSLTAITDTFVTGFTYNGANTFIISQNQGQPDLTATINSVTGLTINGNLVVTGNTTLQSLSATSVNTNLLTLNNVTITGFTSYDYVFTGGTVTGPTNFTNGLSATSVNTNSLIVNGITYTAITDTFVTGFTYNDANRLTISRNQGQSDLNVFINTFSGLTVNGTALINGDVNILGNVNVIGTATTLNTQVVQTRDNRILLNYSGTNLTAIGGGIEVLSAKTDGTNVSLTTDINGDWNSNTNFNVSGKTKTTTLQVTNGATTGYVLTATDSLGNMSWQTPTLFNGGTVTGPTNFTGGLTANTFNTTSLTLNGVVLTAITDTFVTGFTYNNANKLTISQNQGKSNIDVFINTFSGLTINGNLVVTGNTTLQSLSATSVNTNSLTLNNVILTAITDTFTTGFTYDNNNKLTISRNQGQPDLNIFINTMSGLTVNGPLTVTGTTELKGVIKNTGSRLVFGTGLDPETDRSQTLGSSTKSWGNVYTELLTLEDMSGADQVILSVANQTVPGDIALEWELPPTTGSVGTFLGVWDLSGTKSKSTWFTISAGTNINLNRQIFSGGSVITINSTAFGGSFTGGTVSGDTTFTSQVTANGGLTTNGGLTANAGLTATSVNSTSVSTSSLNLNGTIIVSINDNYVTGGTINSSGTLTLNRQNGSVTITGFTTGYTLTSSAISSTLGYSPLSAVTVGVNQIAFGNSTNGNLTSNSEFIRNPSTGYVGIGTSSPSAPLEINVSGLTFGGGPLLNDTTSVLRLQNLGNGSNYTETSILFNSGLDSNASIDTTRLYSKWYGTSSAQNYFSIQPLGLSGGTNVFKDVFTVLGNERVGINIVPSATTATLHVKTQDNPSVSPALFGLIVENSSGNTILSVKNDGNLGIGTSTPTEKLHVSGNTKITGTLNIGTIGSGSPLFNLGLDSSGNVVTGTTGGGTFTGGTVTGPTNFTNGLTANTLTVGTFSVSRKFSSSESFTGSVTKTITHNLNTQDVIVQLWDSSNNLLNGATIVANNVNSVDITVATTATYKVVIIG